MNKLSVCLAVFNEGKNLYRCLDSIVRIADEIVIVDGGSTDNSIQIASKFNAKVIPSDNPLIFHINKQKALNACQYEWILQLDADEVVSNELGLEIAQTIQMTDKEIKSRIIGNNKLKLFNRHELLLKSSVMNNLLTNEVVAFYIPRRNYFLNHPLRYAGMYPDGVIRLLKKGRGKFPCKSVHEQIEIYGQKAWLINDLLHFSNDTINKYITSAKKYIKLLSIEIAKENRVNSITLFIRYLFVKPIFNFFNLYIRHKGVLDGIYGLIFCFLSALHYPLAYIQYILNRRNKNYAYST